MRTKHYVTLLILAFFGNSLSLAQLAQEPVADNQASNAPFCTSPWCICIEEELIVYPGNYSLYLGNRYESYCGDDMECAEPTTVVFVRESGLPPEECEGDGCSFGIHETAVRESKIQVAKILNQPVPHDFQPKFSPNYSGKIQIIHSEFVSFVSKGKERRAKTFLIKITPSVISESKPVRVVGLGFEVENNADTKPVLTVRNDKNVEELVHGIYHVRLGGLLYGIVTTGEKIEVAQSPEKTPTLAVRR